MRRCYASVPSHHESRAGRPETRCAQTSGRLFRLLAALLGAAPKGPEYRQARWRWLGAWRFWRTRTLTNYLIEERLPYVFEPVSAATQRRSGDGCPAHCAGARSMSEDRQSDPSSARIPSTLRIGVHRRSRRCAGCLLCWLLKFGQANESHSHSSAKQKERLAREYQKARGSIAGFLQPEQERVPTLIQYPTSVTIPAKEFEQNNMRPYDP